MKHSGGGRLLLTALTLSVALLVTIASVQAQDFYKGRRLSIIVSYVPGGGYDMYSRLLARHLSRYIPGNPSIIVQNMPGAGSLIGANYLYRLAPRDGTTVGIFGPMQVLRQVSALPELSSRQTNSTGWHQPTWATLWCAWQQPQRESKPLETQLKDKLPS